MRILLLRFMMKIIIMQENGGRRPAKYLDIKLKNAEQSMLLSHALSAKLKNE